jgi:ferredoxin-NADP reductase
MKYPRSNPHLGALYIQAVENQLRDNDPPETRVTLERFQREGHTESDSKRLIATVIAAETFWIMKKKEEFNLNRFVRNLNRLPRSPEEK